MTYELKYEPVTIDNVVYPKYNVYYSDGVVEFHSTDGINGTIRQGYRDINAPNWNGLTQDLKNSPLMGFAVQYAMPNGFTLLNKTLTDGEINSASEQFLVATIGYCFPPGWPNQLSSQQKADLNVLLAKNNFTVSIQ